MASWQTHNIQLANFDVASLRVIWFCSGALLGCLEQTGIVHRERHLQQVAEGDLVVDDQGPNGRPVDAGEFGGRGGLG